MGVPSSANWLDPCPMEGQQKFVVLGTTTYYLSTYIHTYTTIYHYKAFEARGNNLALVEHAKALRVPRGRLRAMR